MRLSDTFKDYSVFLESLILFTFRKSVVEIGVAFGATTFHLCRAVASNGTNGKVVGFDCWNIHGQNKQFPAFGSKRDVEYSLGGAHLNNFTLVEIDTTTPEFHEALKTHCPSIDFAFIDGCHSYAGVKNDFFAIKPFLTEDAIVTFHDTQRIDGIREFIIDLRTIYNDGTFDYIDLPYGGERRAGLGIMTFRKYPSKLKIDEICGSPNTPEQIENKEIEWYNAQLRNHAANN